METTKDTIHDEENVLEAFIQQACWKHGEKYKQQGMSYFLVRFTLTNINMQNIKHKNGFALNFSLGSLRKGTILVTLYIQLKILLDSINESVDDCAMQFAKWTVHR